MIPVSKRPELTGERNRHQPRNKPFRPETLQLISGQQRHRQAEKK